MHVTQHVNMHVINCMVPSNVHLLFLPPPQLPRYAGLVNFLFCLCLYLLWWNFVSAGPHINFLINIHAGDDEEDAGSARPAGQEAAQPEDDRPLVLLHHLHRAGEGEGEGEEYEEDRGDGQHHSAEVRTFPAAPSLGPSRPSLGRT